MNHARPKRVIDPRTHFTPHRTHLTKRFRLHRPPSRSTKAFIAAITIVASVAGVSLVADYSEAAQPREAALYSVVAAQALQLNRTFTALQTDLVDLSASASAPDTTAIFARPYNVTGTKTYDVAVRTSVQASGADNGQAAIDAGGQVAVVWAGVGTIVSAHNYVDARALSLRAGDIVRFSGAASGNYTVVNAINVPKGSAVSTVKQLGTSMMMQTCFFGNGIMRVVGLTATG